MDRINVLMLGGRRCGKTTVLSSMCNEINKALAGTDLQLTILNQQTAADMERAKNAILQKMEIFSTPLTRIKLDDNPTSAQRTYSFGLQISGNGKGIPFQLHDIPGEWLTDEHQQQVKALIQSCQVIIIAIDTPYLFAKMTDKGYGFYHEEYNKPMEIANFFKNSLSVDDVADRMILFVPIKCERYYHLTHTPQLNVFGRDYMQELVNAVSCGYRELLIYLRSSQALLNSCTIAITPILSAGGIDFIKFEKEEETEKMVALYQEPEFLPQAEKGYQPKFCEQPMVYALTYILTQTMDNMANRNPLFQVGINLVRGLNRKKMEAALITLKKKIKRNSGMNAEDGFFIIQNPKGI